MDRGEDAFQHFQNVLIPPLPRWSDVLSFHPPGVVRTTACGEGGGFVRFLASASVVGLICCAGPAPAQTEATPTASLSIAETPAAPPEVGRWRAFVSPYTAHFSSDPDHKPVVVLGLERQRPDGTVWGGAIFSNSFGQPSAYAFGGQRLYDWSRWHRLYAEWTAGLLYGYTGQYKDKVPLNYKGFAPGIVVGLGWQFTPAFAGQVNVLGNSGLMLQLSVELP